MDVTVVGAGVAGLTCAVELAQRGVKVEVLERAAAIGPESCSWYAGGMLAPWCERERAGPLIATLGERGLRWWCSKYSGVNRRGTLVLAHDRDVAELTRFAMRTERFEWLGAHDIADLEPDLAHRFTKGLFFASEAHLHPRAALEFLADRFRDSGGRLRFGRDGGSLLPADRPVIDCTGLAARAALSDLRGVKGEMLVVKSRDLNLQRPVRVLHPRVSVYIVPRGNGVFMVGATTIERDDARGVTARSVLELLSAAYALHPAFGEAEILEFGAHARPAFQDNRPRIRRRAQRLYLNGLYRHGFLLAPVLAEMTAEIIVSDRYYAEVMDEDPGERQSA